MASEYTGMTTAEIAQAETNKSIARNKNPYAGMTTAEIAQAETNKFLKNRKIEEPTANGSKSTPQGAPYYELTQQAIKTEQERQRIKNMTTAERGQYETNKYFQKEQLYKGEYNLADDLSKLVTKDSDGHYHVNTDTIKKSLYPEEQEQYAKEHAKGDQNLADITAKNMEEISKSLNSDSPGFLIALAGVNMMESTKEAYADANVIIENAGKETVEAYKSLELNLSSMSDGRVKDTYKDMIYVSQMLDPLYLANLESEGKLDEAVAKFNTYSENHTNLPAGATDNELRSVAKEGSAKVESIVRDYLKAGNQFAEDSGLNMKTVPVLASQLVTDINANGTEYNQPTLDSLKSPQMNEEKVSENEEKVAILDDEAVEKFNTSAVAQKMCVKIDAYGEFHMIDRCAGMTDAERQKVEEVGRLGRGDERYVIKEILEKNAKFRDSVTAEFAKLPDEDEVSFPEGMDERAKELYMLGRDNTNYGKVAIMNLDYFTKMSDPKYLAYLESQGKLTESLTEYFNKANNHSESLLLDDETLSKNFPDAGDRLAFSLTEKLTKKYYNKVVKDDKAKVYPELAEEEKSKTFTSKASKVVGTAAEKGKSLFAKLKSGASKLKDSFANALKSVPLGEKIVNGFSNAKNKIKDKFADWATSFKTAETKGKDRSNDARLPDYSGTDVGDTQAEII